MKKIPPTYTGSIPPTYWTMHCGNCINHDGTGSCIEYKTTEENCPQMVRSSFPHELGEDDG